MVKNEFIDIKISSSNFNRLKGLGYEFEKNNDVIKIKTEDLSDGSQIKLEVICDVCGSESYMIYAKYVKNVKRNGFYNCKQCGLKNRSKEWIDNNPSTNKEYQDKKVKTFLSKYGVDNPSKSKHIIEKKKQTTNKNYCVDYIFQRKDIMKEGMLEKYGVEHAICSIEILDRMKEGLLEKYGVDNVSKLDLVKKKKEDKSIEKYGTKCVLQAEEVKNKIKETNLKKYGVEYIMQNRELFEKSIMTSYKFGTYKSTGLYYQASYELDFLNKYYDKLIIENGHSINYIMNGDNLVYHSDFYLPDFNLIIEIKSKYTYEKELHKNLLKREYSIKSGYNFLFVIDKEYSELESIIRM
jgi:hypothetical protein